MRLTSLKVRNFRCFEAIDFSLTPNFNLFVGENGRGKTATLDAAAVAIGSWFLGFRDVPTRGIHQDEMRIVSNLVGGKPQFFQTGETEVTAEGVVSETFLSWRLTRAEGLRSRTTTKFASELRSLAREVAQKTKNFSETTLPLLAYYGTARPPLQKRKKVKPQKRRSESKNRLVAYARALDSKRHLSELPLWFATEEWVSFQNGQSTVWLELMREILLSLKSFKGMTKIGYSALYEELTVTNTENGIELFGNLSDGQRSILSLIGDIASRAMVLNPHLGENAVKQTPGVVLVDELDLHLHPEWQRRIIEDLKLVFPSIQFIATTHSPFLIQSLSPGELINLHKQEYLDLAEYSDKSVEDITENVMGVELPQKSERYQDMMRVAEEFYSLLRDPQASPELLQKLEKQLDEKTLPFSDDPAFHSLLNGT